MKRRLNPNACEVCGALTSSNILTYMYGNWRCPECQDNAKKAQKYYIDDINETPLPKAPENAKCKRQELSEA